MSSPRTQWLSRLASRRLIIWTQVLVTFPTISLATLSLWTRNCYFENFGPNNDALFRHPFLKLINPRDNPTTHDCCTREVPFSELDPALLEDARSGGCALIEAFCAGLFGGYGYGIQRRILSWTRNESNDRDLWTKNELLNDKYEPGSYITNFFVVLEKASSFVTFRGCLGPKDQRPRDIDNVGQVSVTIDAQMETARFSLKGIAFDGAARTPKENPFGGPVDILHRAYAKLLVEAAVRHCVRKS